MTKMDDGQKYFIAPAIALLSCAALFTSIGIKASLAEKPEPITIITNIPYQVAEVLPKEQVKAGTFKIVLDIDGWFEQLQSKRNPEKPLITYGQDPNNRLMIEYWLPRRDGTFFYSTDYKKFKWPTFFVTDRIEQNGNRFTLYPVKLTGAIYGGFMGAALFGLLTCVFVWLAFR